ncbi:MAG: hypothetical protein KKH83_03605, partial [Candidatus Margulisbacteria bacterium]|nr:hypothetical protein [Candidatus Margulisiibacteriota bacterium]
MKKLVCFFMLLVLFAGSSYAIYQLKLPEDIPPVIKLETHDKKTGKLQGMEEIRISRVNGGGEELLAIESLAWVNVKNEKYD